MRITLLIASIAASVALATSASAQGPHEPDYVAPAAGVAAGTVLGFGTSEGWWGGVGDLAFPAGVGAGVAGGIVAGAGTMALLDAAIQPCRGFRALFSGFLTTPEGCVNGEWVGDQPPPPRYRRYRR